MTHLRTHVVGQPLERTEPERLITSKNRCLGEPVVPDAIGRATAALHVLHREHQPFVHHRRTHRIRHAGQTFRTVENAGVAGDDQVHNRVRIGQFLVAGGVPSLPHVPHGPSVLQEMLCVALIRQRLQLSLPDKVSIFLKFGLVEQRAHLLRPLGERECDVVHVQVRVLRCGTEMVGVERPHPPLERVARVVARQKQYRRTIGPAGNRRTDVVLVDPIVDRPAVVRHSGELRRRRKRAFFDPRDFVVPERVDAVQRSTPVGRIPIHDLQQRRLIIAHQELIGPHPFQRHVRNRGVLVRRVHEAAIGAPPFDRNTGLGVPRLHRGRRQADHEDCGGYHPTRGSFHGVTSPLPSLAGSGGRHGASSRMYTASNTSSCASSSSTPSTRRENSR